MLKKIIGAAAMAAMFVTLVGCGMPETPKPKTKEGLEATAKKMAEYTQKGEYKKFIDGTLWPFNEEAKEAKIKELQNMNYKVQIVPNSAEIGFGGNEEIGTIGVTFKPDNSGVALQWIFHYNPKTGWSLGS